MKYYPTLLIAIIALGLFNVLRTNYFAQIHINYPNHITVKVPKDTSILEASRSARVPHKSVCGGRGRCLTCRAKIVSVEADVPHPSLHEQRALNRTVLHESIRLTCQLKPVSNLMVSPLINPETNLT